MKRIYAALTALTMISSGIPVMPAMLSVSAEESVTADFTTEEMLAQVNAIRSEQGIPRLQALDELTEVANLLAEEQAESFGFTRPDGSHYTTALHEYQIGYMACAANPTAGQGTLEDAIATMRTNEKYYQNMISEKYTHVAVGHYYDADSEYGDYWVMLLIQLSGGEDQTADFTTEEMLAQINALRTAGGLSELKTLDVLIEAADIRAQELAEKFSHNRPDDSSFSSVLDEKQIAYISCTENLVAGQKSLKDAASAWQESENQYENIMTENYTHVAVGHYYDADSQYGNYWVLLLIEQSDAPKEEEKPVSDFTTEEMLAQINAFRTAEGVPELQALDELTEAANLRAKELTENFAHVRPDESLFSSVLEENQIVCTVSTENISAGMPTLEETLSMWKQNESQYQNIIDAKYTHVAVGYYYDENSEYQHYWALILAQNASVSQSGQVLPGDVNQDSEIDIMDVILLNKALFGKAELSDAQNQAADVDSNEKVDSTDALNIMKYIIKLIDTF